MARRTAIGDRAYPPADKTGDRLAIDSDIAVADLSIFLTAGSTRERSRPTSLFSASEPQPSHPRRRGVESMHLLARSSINLRSRVSLRVDFLSLLSSNDQIPDSARCSPGSS
jgi:hypothetical protein